MSQKPIEDQVSGGPPQSPFVRQFSADQNELQNQTKESAQPHAISMTSNDAEIDENGQVNDIERHATLEFNKEQAAMQTPIRADWTPGRADQRTGPSLAQGTSDQIQQESPNSAGTSTSAKGFAAVEEGDEGQQIVVNRAESLRFSKTRQVVVHDADNRDEKEDGFCLDLGSVEQVSMDERGQNRPAINQTDDSGLMISDEDLDLPSISHQHLGKNITIHVKDEHDQSAQRFQAKNSLSQSPTKLGELDEHPELLTDRNNENLETEAPLVAGIILEDIADLNDQDSIEAAISSQKSIKRLHTSVKDLFSKKYIGKMHSKAQNSKGQPGWSDAFKYESSSCDKISFYLGLLVALCNGFLGASHALIVGQLINSFDSYATDPNNMSDRINHVLPQFVIICALMILLGYLQAILLQRVASNVDLTMRRQLIKSLLVQDTTFFEQLDHDQIPKEISQKFDSMQLCFSSKLGKIYFAIGAILGSLALSIYISPSFTLGLVIVSPALMCATALLSFCIFQTTGETDFDVKMSELGTETLSSIKYILASSEENSTIQKFSKLQTEAQEQSISQKKTTGMRPVVNSGLLLCFVMYAWALVSLFEENNWGNGKNWDEGDHITVTESYICIEALIFSLILLPLLVSQLKSVKILKKDFVSLIEFLDREPAIKTMSIKEGNTVRNITFKRGITFSDVTYNNSQTAASSQESLSGVNFKIKPSLCTALVSSPGQDKSAILNLMARTCDPTEGQIVFGSFDNLKSLNLDIFRSQVAFISANPRIIRGSIIENILLGNQKATRGQLKTALEVANADFVDKIPQDALVGFKNCGYELTLSQKHRIAMVRALICEPKLIIIEDITSKLEPSDAVQYAQAVKGILRYAKQNEIMTVIATDRLSFVRQCDQLLYLESSSSVIEAVQDSFAYNEIFENLRNDLQLGKRQAIDENSFSQEDQVDCIINDQADSIDIPREITETKQNSQSRASMIYDSQFTRVLSYNKDKWKTYVAYLLTLINACCYPVLAYAFIRLQILFFSFEHHRLADSASFGSRLDIDEADYYEDKIILFSLFVGTTLTTCFLQSLTQTILAPMSHQVEANLRIDLLIATFKRQAQINESRDQESHTITHEVKQLTDAAIQTVFMLFEVQCMTIVSLIFCTVICWQNTLILAFMGPILIYTMRDFKRYIAGSCDQNPEIQQSKKTQQDMLADVVQNQGLLSKMTQANLLPIITQYERLFTKQTKLSKQNAHARGCRIGFAQAGRNLFLFSVFVFGQEALVNHLEIQADDVLVTIIVLFLIFSLVGFKLGSLPFETETEKYAFNIFSVIDAAKLGTKGQNDDTGQENIRFGSLEFQSVSVDGKVKELSMMCPALETTGIAKKNLKNQASQIGRLLKRECEPDEGTVLIDGKRIDYFNKKGLRSFIHCLDSDAIIFNMSIRDNIAFGCDGVSSEQIYLAAHQAQALGFIADAGADSDQILGQNKVEMRLDATIGGLQMNFPNLQQLSKILANPELNSELKHSLLEILTYGDMRVIENINLNPRAYFKLILKAKAAFKSANLSWIDLVLIIELYQDLMTWQWENESTFRREIMSRLKNFCKDKENASTFDPDEVFAGLKSILAGKEDDQFIRTLQAEFQKISNSTTTMFTEQTKRREELFKSQTEAQRAQDGSFKLSPGFNRICGKKGCNLSQSQKLRIAIARSILQSPKVVILDNVTAGLDSHSRSLVEKAMDHLTQGRTALVISSQSSQLSKCNKVLVMEEQGSIIEEGTFKALTADPDSHFNKFKKGK